MNGDASERTREPDRRRHRRGRGHSRSAGRAGREDRDRSRRALRARGAGAARRAEEGRPRRLRGAARAAEEGRLPGDGARRGHRRGKRRHGRARPDAGRHPDRPRAVGRAVPRAGRHRLRRPRHQRPSRDLADPRQGLPPLAGAPLLRGDAGRAEFRGAAIGAERDRGQGAFRCARTRRPYPRRRAGRPALSRPRRRDLAGGGDRRHRLAGDRQSAGALPPRRRDAAFAGAGARRIDRDAALLPQRPVRRRLRAGGRLGAGRACAIAAPIR